MLMNLDPTSIPNRTLHKANISRPYFTERVENITCTHWTCLFDVSVYMVMTLPASGISQLRLCLRSYLLKPCLLQLLHCHFPIPAVQSPSLSPNRFETCHQHCNSHPYHPRFFFLSPSINIKPVSSNNRRQTGRPTSAQSPIVMSPYEPTTPPTPSPAHRQFVSLPHHTASQRYPFSRQIPSTRPSSASYSQYRDPDINASLSFDTDVVIETQSCMSEDDLNSRSDIESVIDADFDNQLADDEDDEVDIDTALQESVSLPQTPALFTGKKRARSWEQTPNGDGADEAEAEGILGWSVKKGKSRAMDRKPYKFAKRVSLLHVLAQRYLVSYWIFHNSRHP